MTGELITRSAGYSFIPWFDKFVPPLKVISSLLDSIDFFGKQNGNTNNGYFLNFKGVASIIKPLPTISSAYHNLFQFVAVLAFHSWPITDSWGKTHVWSYKFFQLFTNDFQ